jgi:aspartyl-tRNA(Asn)/glutamyl-tRNA(Gln) amidotransferase subunit A
MSLTDLTLFEATKAVGKGEVTSLDLVESTLNRIDAVDPKLNAFIRVEADTARSEAAEIDQARAAGKNLGPLAGVPLAHKDMYYRAGGLTTCGSKIRKDFRPTVTSTALTRLKTDGAVYLGGLNMAEFAFGPTGHNEHFGACRNPWDPSRITGGSSSGSGSATAARMTFGALGSDTGGSIRLPAGLCGIVGMKPTQTRVSRFGVMGLSFSLDNVGPLTRTVLDNALMLASIAGYDPEDPTSSTVPVDDYVGAAQSPSCNGIRIGVARGYFEKDADAAALTARDEALAAFKSAGAVIVETDAGNLDDVKAINALSALTMGPEAATLHAHWLRTCRDDYGAQMRARCEPGFQYSGVDYLSALQLRPKIVEEFIQRVFSDCDFLLAPTFNVETPTIEETDVLDHQGFEAVIARISQCTRPFNYLTLPGLALPTPSLVAGMPGSIQLVGPPFSEAKIYQAAAAYEVEAGYTKRSPDL